MKYKKKINIDFRKDINILYNYLNQNNNKNNYSGDNQKRSIELNSISVFSWEKNKIIVNKIPGVQYFTKCFLNQIFLFLSW